MELREFDEDLSKVEPFAHPSRPGPTFLDAQAKAAATVAPVKCYACKGSGKFVSRYGRTVGSCFTCKGSGLVTAKAAKRNATVRANAANRVAEDAVRRAEFAASHPDVIDWVRTNDGRNTFATSLSNWLSTHGTLTANQVRAVREGLAKLARAQEEQRTAVIAKEPTGSGLDLSRVPDGTYAVPNGDTRLKVRIQKPEPPSRWAGFIFVSDGAAYGSARRYGRQAPGRTYTGDIVEALTAIAANPREASAAYGRLVGRCGVCGRKLEDEQSVARGIGPICLGKFE